MEVHGELKVIIKLKYIKLELILKSSYNTISQQTDIR